MNLIIIHLKLNIYILIMTKHNGLGHSLCRPSKLTLSINTVVLASLLKLVRHITHPILPLNINQRQHLDFTLLGQIKVVKVKPEEHWARPALIVHDLILGVCSYSPHCWPYILNADVLEACRDDGVADSPNHTGSVGDSCLCVLGRGDLLVVVGKSREPIWMVLVPMPIKRETSTHLQVDQYQATSH